MSWTVFILAGVFVLGLILAGLRWADRRADSSAWSALIDRAAMAEVSDDAFKREALRAAETVLRLS